MAIVDVEGLTRRFPSGGGFSDITFAVERGESMAIIGPSGCGKTTLLHVLAGIAPFDDGRCQVDATRVGLVQQRDALLPWRTAAENVRLGVAREERGAPSGRNRIDHLAASLGITAVLDAYPGRLSGGERQRVAIAQALAGDPELILLDEPSSALDAQTREALQDLLLELQREQRFASIFVTHAIEEALFLAPRVAVMSPRGTIAAWFDNPTFPDATARTDRAFHERQIELRRILDGVIRAAA